MKRYRLPLRALLLAMFLLGAALAAHAEYDNFIALHPTTALLKDARGGITTEVFLITDRAALDSSCRDKLRTSFQAMLESGELPAAIRGRIEALAAAAQRKGAPLKRVRISLQLIDRSAGDGPRDVDTTLTIDLIPQSDQAEWQTEMRQELGCKVDAGQLTTLLDELQRGAN